MIVSEFFDITIRFNSNSKYNSAHFHAEYKNYNVIVDISEYEVVKGSMPRRQANLILGWCSLHEDELMQNWTLMTEGLELNQIQGLTK